MDMTNRERCLLRAIGMLKDRKNYYYNARNLSTSGVGDGMYCAYDSAATILDYAWDENWEALNQFDYFGKESQNESKS